MRLNMRDGFVTLISVILIVASLTVIVGTIGLVGFFGRFNVLSGEFKDKSSILAESCAGIAAVKLAEANITGDAYFGNETGIPIGTDFCDIGTILDCSSSSNTFVVQSSGEFKNAHTFFHAYIDSDMFRILRLKEFPTFTAPVCS